MDLSDSYANAAHIPKGDSYPDLWRDRRGRFLSAHGDRVSALQWGPGTRHQLQLVRPAGPAAGVLVFVHGGYWQAFSPGDFLHLAAGALAHGWAVALPGYDLCPEVRIGTITSQVAAALTALAEVTEGPMVLSGHSAGGHLVARMGCADVGMPGAVRDRIARIVPISPLSDLRPLMRTDLNTALELDSAEAETESPALHPAPEVPVHVWVGGDERPAFLDQARWLGAAWDCPVTVEPGRHHFDVIEGLERESPLLTACLNDAG